MISRASINDRVREWGLREDIVEKDYVLGWLLWGIGADPTLSSKWVFKGGTCLKKCYIETYRFSEDLDFTVVDGGPIQPTDLEPVFAALTKRVTDQSGIDFSVEQPRFRAGPSGLTAEGRVYYRGPRNAPGPASIKFDLSANEAVVRPTVLRRISHPHEDQLPSPGTVRCYGFEEVFAEKLRALAERLRPRDLYDVVNLFRRRDLRSAPKLIQSVLDEKCQFKAIEVPTFASIDASPFRTELEAEWENMLGHQLPTLPPFASFWDELPFLFGWLGGETGPGELPQLGYEADQTWSPPPTVWLWGMGVPFETIRFAAANHLCVVLGYQGRKRVIEPYSLRRTKDDNLLLHALRADSHEHRAYRVDQIQSVEVSNRVFRPTYLIEFAQMGPIAAQPTRQGLTSPRPASRSRSRRSSRTGTTYVIQCPACERQFSRTRNNTTLRPHKTKGGWPCPQRRGYIAEIR